MATYVAFLRAINLGARRKFPMAELRACLEAAGLADVETYINTGNVRFGTRLRSTGRVGAFLEEAFSANRGFEVPTVVFAPAELRAVYADVLALEQPIGGECRRYVTLLRDQPDAATAAAVDALSFEGEAARVVGRAVHVWLTNGIQGARLDNARLERALGVATTRDLKVIATLAERWGA